MSYEACHATKRSIVGKSTELLRRVRRHLAAARKCLLIKYKGDTRYGQEQSLTTHDMVHMTAKSVGALTEADNAVWHYDVVAVDEGQFFPGAVADSACRLPMQTQHAIYAQPIVLTDVPNLAASSQHKLFHCRLHTSLNCSCSAV